MNIKKRRAYLKTLEAVAPSTFFSVIEPWLYGERPLPRVATSVTVSTGGAVPLTFSDAASIIWGWTLQREMRGKTALLIPYEKKGVRALVVANTDCTVWVSRFFDPIEHAFWTWGRKKIPDLRIYTFVLPPTRRVRVCEIECLFNGKWKPGKPISVQVSRGEIVTISGYMMKRDALLRRVVTETGAEKIIVGTQLPRREILETITGTVPDVPVHQVRHYGSCVVFGTTRIFLTTDDENKIGLARQNAHLTLEVEAGIPTAISGGNGVSIQTTVIRGSDGRPVAASRSKVEKCRLPQIASVHRIKVIACQDDRFIRAAGKRFRIPNDITLAADTSLIVVLEAGTRILYISQHEKLTDAERALILLFEQFAAESDHDAALQNIIRTTAKAHTGDAFDPIGIRWLYKILLKQTEHTSKPALVGKDARGIRLQLLHRLRTLATPPRPSP